MDSKHPSMPCERTKRPLNIDLRMRELEDGSLQDHTSEDAFVMADIVRGTPRWFHRVLLTSIFATATGIAALIWLAVVLTLIARLRPHKPTNGLQNIIRTWREPSDSTRLLSLWSDGFSRDIVPKPYHSHNDYWRRVPLFDALAAGCTSIEADIWLPDAQSTNIGTSIGTGTNTNTSTELRVGHTKSSLTSDRTLSKLYIEPLAAMLRNTANSTTEDGGRRGIFETDPSKTVTLLLDFKSDGAELWPLVNAHLEPLRTAGFLRYWDGPKNQIIPGPLTVVATGNAPFDLIAANTTRRDIFYDAPLHDLSSNIFDTSNSFFASAALGRAIGKPVFGHFAAPSMAKLTAQVADAESKGLVSRYWDTPAWPVSARDRVWNTLVSNGVGALNVDDLQSAARWNWDWCVVAGITLCGW